MFCSVTQTICLLIQKRLIYLFRITKHQADEANATYYDLSGRRVIRPAKGIYVKNGRKVYVK